MDEALRKKTNQPAVGKEEMRDQFIRFLKKNGGIPAEDEATIKDAMQPRYYKEGECLFREGKVCNQLFFVCDGILRIAGITDAGNEVNFFFVAENHLCTLMLSFTNRVPATDNIIAACDVSVLSVSYESLQKMFQQFPYLQPLLINIQQQAFMQKIALRNHYLSHEDATTRYKLFMEQMPTVATRVSLTNIASYLGITPQSLSRIRRSLV